MAEPRGIEERIKWFLSNSPGGVGWCARHTWRALGGDQGNPPRWYCANANEVIKKVRAAGKLYTTDLMSPPRGAVVLYEYGANGHMALSLGDGRIATTDPSGKPGGTGIEPITYPARWGAPSGGRPTGWTDYYAGTTIDVASRSTNDTSRSDSREGAHVSYIEKARAAWQFIWSGKEKHDQVILADGKWRAIKGTLLPAPDISGEETHFLYARVQVAWKTTSRRGAWIVVRWVRDEGTPNDRSDDDATGLTPIFVPRWISSVPLPALHMEAGEKGVAGHWEMRISPASGAKSAKIVMTYDKTSVVAPVAP